MIKNSTFTFRLDSRIKKGLEIAAEKDRRSMASLLEKIIVERNVDTLVEYADYLGRRVAGEELGRTQIRNIYGMVKAFQSKRQSDLSQLKLMIPKLKYAAARESKLSPLVEALSKGIELVGTDPNRFKNFADFFEAVVAYHYVASEERKKQKELSHAR